MLFESIPKDERGPARDAAKVALAAAALNAIAGSDTCRGLSLSDKAKLAAQYAAETLKAMED